MTAYELLKGRGQEGTESDDSKAEFFRAIHLHSTRAMPTLTSLCPSMPPELSALIKKALALDPDDRYSNFCALLHDLHKVKQICDGTLRGSARRDFIVGHIDYQSRFAIPPALLDREEEYGMLDQAYRLVKTTGQSQVACVWGVSGSGKSKLLETWARRKEADNAGQDCFVSWAKVSCLNDNADWACRLINEIQMDQHLVKPLSAFISVFCSLLERVFSDPLESASDWRQKILDSLAVNANIFLALLPKEWRAILLDGQVSDEMDSDMTAGIDWESWVKQFRTWSYGLLRLFASEARPLVSHVFWSRFVTF
jgi:serine/threonine protein kinase